MKKLEIEKTKPTFITSVLKVDILKVGLVFSISNFFITKTPLAKLEEEKNTFLQLFGFTTPLHSTIVLFLLELETTKVNKLYYWSSFKIMATALVTWTERLSQPEESRSLSWMFGSLHTYTKIIVKLHWWHLGEHLHNRVGSMNCK